MVVVVVVVLQLPQECDYIPLDVRTPEFLAGVRLRFEMTRISQLHVELPGSG